MNLQQFQQEFPVIIEQTVAWGEMDAFQHVNNTIYLKYFESARIAYMQAIHLNLDVADSKNNNNSIGPILADSYCRFRRPVTFPDQLLIGVRISELQEYGFVMEYHAFSKQQQTIVTLGHSRIVMLNYLSGQKAAVEGDLLANILELQTELSKDSTS